MEWSDFCFGWLCLAYAIQFAGGIGFYPAKFDSKLRNR